MKRTDLAYESASKKDIAEGVTLERSSIGGISAVNVTVKPEGSEKAGKPSGDYMTLFCPNRDVKAETAALTKTLAKFLPVNGKAKVLVAGLGNSNITPDALGPRTADRVLATAHLLNHPEAAGLNLREVYVTKTGVMGQTGIESASQLRYIADGVKPDIIIAIDSLACSEAERLGKTIQITDTGINPGSGVRNERAEISAKTFGAAVTAIGVPTVTDVKQDGENFMAVPYDIDVLVNHFAKVISMAINAALNPTLSEEEAEMLLF